MCVEITCFHNRLLFLKSTWEEAHFIFAIGMSEQINTCALTMLLSKMHASRESGDDCGPHNHKVRGSRRKFSQIFKRENFHLVKSFKFYRISLKFRDNFNDVSLMVKSVVEKVWSSKEVTKG
jgi:hypothetical protein